MGFRVWGLRFGVRGLVLKFRILTVKLGAAAWVWTETAGLTCECVGVFVFVCECVCVCLCVCVSVCVSLCLCDYFRMFFPGRDHRIFVQYYEEKGAAEVSGALVLSHVTRHTSHVTRHTSHVKRHTSHVARHMPYVTCHRYGVHTRSHSSWMVSSPRSTR